MTYDEIKGKIDNLGKEDLIGMIELAVARNIGGFNRTMIDDSADEMCDYLFETLDDEGLDSLYYRYIG